MILDEEIYVLLCGSNIRHYEKLGYAIPRERAKDNHKNRFHVPKGTRIWVKVDDLPSGSNEMINCECDYCGQKFQRMYMTIHRERQCGNYKLSCGKPECLRKRIEDTKIIKYGTTSQIEICRQNNSKIGRNIKFTIDDFVREFDKHNLDIVFDLIQDTDRLLVTDNIPYICRNHAEKGVQYTSLDVIRNRIYCCRYGGFEATAQKQSTVDIADAQKICDERGYTLLTQRITSVDSTIEYICNQHPNYGIQTTTLYGMTHYDCNCRLCAMQKISGENNWNWRGGLTSKNESDRKTWQYKEWRQSVYQRDNFTCQCCGRNSNEVSLNAHHILNFSDYEDLRYDVDNGITLCEECHSINYPNSFHSIYGVSNNTKEQLDEYINNIKKINLTIQND